MKKMNIDVYTSNTNSGKHISAPAGVDVVPFASTVAATDPDYASLKTFKKNLTIQAGGTRIAIDEDDVIAQIEARGFALHKTSISFTVNV